MANVSDAVPAQMEQRRPAKVDICPLKSKSFRTHGEIAVLRLDMKLATTPYAVVRQGEQRTPVSAEGRMVETGKDSSHDELGRLDIDLDRKSKQHNLTSRNVRAILHEVITHERVVAMMKAAIRDTQDMPMFEPKMTRSRLKQAVQQGQGLTWSMSAANTVKTRQFVDINLEEEDDSSDEEYWPEEEEDEEEEDTAEETFLSDADSLASPYKTHQGSQQKCLKNQGTDVSQQSPPGHLLEQLKTSSSCSPQQPLTAPETSFLERLNAVEEQLDCSPDYTFSQCLDRKTDDDGGGDEGSTCLAYRTRSKLPLVNVPLGQLEAELLAPDITADMYEQSAAKRKEDRHWTRWLQGLMAPDNEEEADDDDDPEYNFLDDPDEPDLEDYRTDRAVQITKREVNQLLDELFDTLQEHEGEEEEEERKEEQQQEAPPQAGPKFNVPEALRFEAPLAGMLTERRRTVRRQYEALQQRRALQDTPHVHLRDGPNVQLRGGPNVYLRDTPNSQPKAVTSFMVLPGQAGPALQLNPTQKLQLLQQVQQHVQLLTQVHLLCRRVDALNHEACITKHYLEELQRFATHREQVLLPTSFRVCNLQGALDLVTLVEQRAEPLPARLATPSGRWLPIMTSATNSHAFPLLPADTAWLFATQPIFLYPELLPVCNLDHIRYHRRVYTPGENGLLVLGLKHFEGTPQSDQLISSYLLCKTRWSIRKHIREMSGTRAPHDSVIKTFLLQRVVPPLPLACSWVLPGHQRPPVDKNTINMPNWLKNSQSTIQKTRLNSTGYPASLPTGCSLRLHPNFLSRSRPPLSSHRRVFTLAHNASLLPLAKAPTDIQMVRQVDIQPIADLLPPAVTHPVPTNPLCADIVQSCLPIVQTMQQSVSRQQDTIPLLNPLPAINNPNSTIPIIPCTTATANPGSLFFQMMWTPPAPPNVRSRHAVGPQILIPNKDKQEKVKRVSARPRLPLEEKIGGEVVGREKRQVEEQLGWVEGELRQVEEVVQEQEESSPLTGSPLSPGIREKEEEKEENWAVLGVVSLSGGECTGGEEDEGRKGGGGVEGGGQEETVGEEDGEAGGEDGEQEEQRDDGGGDREEEGDKDKDEDQERHGEEEEEEEDFDDLTQDEDEEEVMSSASEESVLSVPELQETMKQLTWLAAERRLCADGDSEEENSPGSQEEEEEEEEEVPKGEEPGERRSRKVGGDEELRSGEMMPRGGGRCSARGRGRSRPPRSLRRSRQERHSKDASKLLLLYDENILDNDPHRESKDVAFAQSYLNRVREALQDVPGQVEAFVSLLNQFEYVGEGQELTLLFRKLRGILGDKTDLLRDFAAFLHPEQALQCGLFEEQQAFERSRRFLRQLEISFGDNPSHYQKIIKALQTGPDLSPTSIHELKSQMASLLKGYTHLQAEFWVFFEELRPSPARPGQFEEARWPEDGGGGSDSGEGVGQVSGGGAASGFEEVTLPELEEEEEGHKIQPMTSRRQRRKMDARTHRVCDWSDKDWLCLCRDAKIRRHRGKGCPRCHGNKSSGSVSRAMKSPDPVYSQLSSARDELGDKELDVKGDSQQPDQSSALWEGHDEKEEEPDEEEEEYEEERKKRSRTEEEPKPPITSAVISTCPTASSIIATLSSSIIPSVSSSIISSISPSLITSSITSSISSYIISPAPPRPSPAPDLPVCAKNISLTASGEKVILWTREADRVILTRCQQEGANQNTFQAISNVLGNKTPSEVSQRFRDLMSLFRTAARQTSYEDQALPTESTVTNDGED